MNLAFLVYVSTAAHAFEQPDLDMLLLQSRTYNARADITGMLLYKDREFMQALEGPLDGLRALLAKIEADPRHQNLTILADGPIRKRSFAGWEMGFQRLDGDDAAAPPGFSTFLREPLTSPTFRNNPDLAHRLLRGFRNLHTPE